jgi:ubiquinone/menaquinone biosynthesis C-methylase UbiE
MGLHPISLIIGNNYLYCASGTVIIFVMAKDNFSKHAADYASFRPTYSQELIDFVVSKVSIKGMALDVATGNGQVAIRLSKHFNKVHAIDLSSEQILQAKPRQNIKYHVALAENTPFEDQTFDLITVAQALHWFKFDDFFREMNRIAKKGAILAIWGYGRSHVDLEVDSLFNDFNLNLLGAYWDPERDFIETEYSDIKMPFIPFESPYFSITVNWTLEQYIKYIQTWSAVKHYMAEHSEDPTLILYNEFSKIWPVNEVRTISFPIFMHIGEL